MRPSNGQTLVNVIVLTSIFLLGIYGYLLVTFVGNNAISSFTTDSGNYLVMARYLSPWHETAAAISAAWPQQDFPVLFPLLLAISGTAHDYFLAHTVTALLLVVSLPLVYSLARDITLNRKQSLIVTLLFAISPAAWVNSLGILSENLYILLTVSTLLFYQRLDRHNRLQLCLFGFLLAAVVLTRTVGVSLLAGYFLLIIIEHWHQRRQLIQAALPVVVAAGLILLTEIFHSTMVPDQYIDQMLGLLENDVVASELEFNLLQQFTAIVDAWFVSWMYYWNGSLVASYAAFAIVGVLALGGMAWRAMKLELDALYLVAYLLILILWPHPGQMVRFIYPILFLLLINALFAGRALLSKLNSKPRLYLSVFFISICLLSILPAQLYTYHRYNLGKEIGCQHYREFYMLPDLVNAKETCVVQAVIRDDLVEIGKTTEPDDRIMYFIPAYVAILSDRIGIKIDFYRDETGMVLLRQDQAVDYVYLSRLHPRKTRDTINGLSIAGYFDNWTTLIKRSYTEETRIPVSILLKVNR